jgi:signal transduction histidine kinase/ligand-binding sensor domain-containing protein/CheY-like chemotaxis protein
MRASFLKLIVIFIFLYFNVSAQPEWVSLKFNHISTKNGLSNSEVSCLVQDKYGYIWIGTKDGLNRYDGFNIKVYKHNSDKVGIIIDNSITKLHVDKSGRLWVGTLRGISVYNEKNDAFDNYILDTTDVNNFVINRVTDFIDDVNGNIVAVTEAGSLFKMNASQNKMEKLNIPSFGIIKAMITDAEGNVYIASQNGLVKYSFTTGIIWHKRIGSKGTDIPSDKLTTLCLNGTELWVGTEDKGIFVVDIKSKELICEISSTYGQLFTQHIAKDYNGNIWAGTYSGLRLFKKGLKKSIDYYHVSEDLLSLGGSGVTSIYADMQNNIWIGLGHVGVDFVINNKKFEHYRSEPLSPYGLSNDVVSTVCSDSKGRLWIGGHNGGLNIIQNNKNGIIRITSSNANNFGIDMSSVVSIYEDKDGVVWVGTYSGGLYYWNEIQAKFGNYKHNPDDPNSLPCNDVRSIAEDTLGNFWIVTHGSGVTKFNKRTKKITNFKHDFSNPLNSILDDWSFVIKATSDGMLWIGGTSGITVLNPYELKYKYFQYKPNDQKSLTKGFVNYIFEDKNKEVWVATDYGFCKYDTKSNAFINYSEKAGVVKSRFCGILEDNENNLWISSNNGLYFYNPANNYIKGFDENDGLQSNEFSPGACSMSIQGELFFGGRSGVTGFYPSEISDNKFIAPILITDIKLFNESMLNPLLLTNEKLKIRHDFLTERNIVLTYNQNVLTIEFVAFNYINPQKNRYAYKLEGFDDHWDTIMNKRDVTYTNLNPGTYTFVVKASNSDGYWNEKADKLIITIVPPVWKRLWFRLLIILLVGSLIFLALYMRFQRIKAAKILLEQTVNERTQELQNANEEILQQHQELAKHRDHLEDIVYKRTHELENAKMKAEESDRLKSSFLANMSHEIRTPMNAITGFIYLLRDDSLDNELKNKYINIISRNSDVLLRLIDDILDFSKIEAGELKISFLPVSILSMLDDLSTSYTSLIKDRNASSMRNVVFKINNKLDKSIISNNPKLVLSTDKMRLNQIITNLIENAIKFTEKGYIEVGIEDRFIVDDTGDYIEIYVEDTGIGIPEEELPFIFDRFRKVESDISKIYRGVGLGLAISKRLAYLLGGNLSVKSESGKGSRFSLLLPYRDEINGSESVNIESPNEDRTEGILLNEKTILIAEDDESNYKFLETVLLKDGFKILWAKDGEEAVKIALNTSIDLVLMDIKLPLLNGILAMKKIKESKPNLPVIAQTAYAMANERIEMLKSGFEGYISKPISFDVLKESIKKILRNS